MSYALIALYKYLSLLRFSLAPPSPVIGLITASATAFDFFPVNQLIGALIFFVVTNFGVWSLGSYGYDFNGFLACYTLAIPFFGYSLVSTLFFSLLIEGVISIKKINSFLVNLK